jgi:hypothetical protein
LAAHLGDKVVEAFALVLQHARVPLLLGRALARLEQIVLGGTQPVRQGVAGRSGGRGGVAVSWGTETRDARRGALAACLGCARTSA